MSDTVRAKANEVVVTSEAERKAMKNDIEFMFGAILDTMAIDWKKDHNTEGTPKRLAKMFVDEIFAGRYEPMPKVTTFPNVAQLDEIYSVGPIHFRSTCSHHFAPILGEVWISVRPNGKLIGLSKFSRVTDWFMSRPHIQEEAIQNLATLFEQLIEPRGLAITMKATHHCMTWRGVKEHDTTMVNTVLRGDFLANQNMKKEHYSIIKSQGF